MSHQSGYTVSRQGVSFSPENLEISRKLLIFAVETMNEYGQTGIR